MGCAASKDSAGAQVGRDQGEAWRKPDGPGPTAAGPAGPSTPRPEGAFPPGSLTTSDGSTSSHSSQLSTWDMRTMQGPLTRGGSGDTPPAAKPLTTAATTPGVSPAPSSLAATPPLSIASFSSAGGSGFFSRPSPTPPSFSRRLRSPSLLGTPALDTPVIEKTASTAEDPATAPTSRLLVTKINGCTLVNQYLVVQYLGRGTSGKVFLCMDVSDRRLYAVKIVRKTRREGSDAGSAKGSGAADTSTPTSTSDSGKKAGGAPGSSGQGRRRLRRRPRDPLEDLRREIAILRSAGGHPNVVALREVVDDPGSNKMLIVMEYCEGGPVMTRAGLERGRRIPEAVARPYFRDMLSALAYLHAQRVVHGDLKPENALMCAAGRLAVSDFGCSKVLPPGAEAVERCNGTPAFLAPEMMTPGAPFRGRPADVYALGACLFTFLYGRIPFSADTVAELFAAVRTKPLEFPSEPSVSPEARDLLEKLLEKDPAVRAPLAAAASHPWTTDGGRLPPPVVPKERADGGMPSPGLKKDASGKKLLDSSEHPHAVEGDAALAALLEIDGLSVATFAEGQWVLRQGGRGASLFYVLEGEVEVLYRPPAEAVPPGLAEAPAVANNVPVDTSPKPATPKLGPMQKLWSPTSRLRRAARSGGGAAAATPTPPLPPLPAPQVSPRLIAALVGVNGTPEPSPRLPGAPDPSPSLASSSFHLPMAQVAPGGGGSGSHQDLSSVSALNSAVTTPLSTPAITPLPSARGSAPPPLPVATGTPPRPIRPDSAPERVEATPDSASKLTAHPLPLADVAVMGEAQALTQGDADVDISSEGEGGSESEVEVTAFGDECDEEADCGGEEASSRPAPPMAPQWGSPFAIALSSSPPKSSTPRVPTISEEIPLALSSAAAVATEAAGAGPPAPDDLTFKVPLSRPTSAASGSSWGPGPGLPDHPLLPRAFSARSEATVATSAGDCDTPGDNLPSSLASAAEEAAAFVASLHRGGREFLMALRGPGDFLGEAPLIGGSGLRLPSSARARPGAGQLRLVEIPYSAAKVHFKGHPLAKQRLAEVVWARQGEAIVLEGLLRLASIAPGLRDHAASGLMDSADV